MSYPKKSMHRLVGKLRLQPREEDQVLLPNREREKKKRPVNLQTFLNLRNFSISARTSFLHWEITPGQFYNTGQLMATLLKRCVVIIVYLINLICSE